MKKVLFVSLFIIGLFLCGCGECKECKEKESNELDIILSEIPSSSSFLKLDECDECKELDAECKIIIGVKKKLDASLISLRKLWENYNNNADNFSDKTVFTEQIIQMSSLGLSVQNATNEYKQHVEYIQNFLSATPESIYEKAKKAMASGDPALSDKVIITELTNYTIAQASFSGVLNSILGFVSGGNLVAAAKVLRSKEVYDYYLSTAKMLKSLYVFEESRAVSIKKTYDSYCI